MNDKKLTFLLQQAYSVKAPQSLYTTIKGMAQSEKKLLSGGLFIMQPAFVLAVVILVVTLGSGAVVASASKPGSPLFPIKKAVVQVQMALSKDKNTQHQLQQEILEPTNTPIPTQASENNESNKNRQQNFHHIDEQSTHEKKDVKGVSTFHKDHQEYKDTFILSATITPFAHSEGEGHDH